MRNRWIILVLFVARLTMAFQFQSVAAVAPLLGSEFGVSLADIGILIGLYFTPGVAHRSGRPELILAGGCIAFAMLLVALPRSSAVLLNIIALGLVCGLPAGPILSLPARELQPATRAIGMGVFYTVYYATMMLGPAVGGACAKWAGSAAAAFDFGAAMTFRRRCRKWRKCPSLARPLLTPH